LEHQVEAAHGKRRGFIAEQGVAILSSMPRSMRAVRVNIEIMHAFVRLRRMPQSNTVLARQLMDPKKKNNSQQN